MVDARISELPAAASVADAAELEINDAGTSRKATAAQIRNPPNNQTQRLTYVDAGGLAGPFFEAFRDSVSPAPSDLLGGLAILGRSSAGSIRTLVSYGGLYTDPVDGTEDAQAFISGMAGGVETAFATFDIAGVEAPAYEIQGNPVVTSARHFQLRPYTLATLPVPATAGQLIECTNLGGSRGLLIGDGTNWRRVADGGVGDIGISDADLTLIPLQNAPYLRHTSTLTADRTITLSTTGAYNGAVFHVARTGGGAFNLNFMGKALATGTWAEARFGLTWVLMAYGSL